MTQRKSKSGKSGEQLQSGLGGILKGLGDLVEKLGELAEKGETLSRTGEFGTGKGLKGVYGFSVKVVPGGEGLKVEPFGNIGQRTRQLCVSSSSAPIPVPLGFGTVVSDWPRRAAS